MTSKPDLRKRNPKSHKAVLKAASQLLVEREYCSVTIDQIAERAGVGKQTIYRWWPSKTAIYIELYDTIAKRNFKPINSGRLKKDLELYAAGVYSQLTNPVASLAFKGMVAEAQNSLASHELFRSYMRERFLLSRKIIESAITRGEISKKTDIDSVSSLIGGAIVWRLLLNDKPLNKKLLQGTVKTVFAGLIASNVS